MRRLHIAIDARPLVHPYNGIGQYLCNLLDHLLPQSPHRWLLYAHQPFDVHAQWSGAVLRCGRPGVPFVSTLRAQTTFAAWALADRADVFWGPRHQLPMRWPGRLPSVLTVHDLVWRSYPETMTRMGRITDRLTMPGAIQRAHAVLTTSNAVRTDVARHYPQARQKLHVIPLASSIDQFPPQPAELTQPYFVFCGSVEPRKNLLRLLRAFLSLTHGATPVPHKLVIITGGGWDNLDVDRLLGAHPERVLVLRNISEQRKAALLQHADFLVQPSLYEGFGLPLVEALKCGLPILAADRGALPEVAGSAAIYIDPESEDALRAALLRLCTDLALRERLASAALREARRFDWGASARATQAVLEGVARADL